MYARHMSATAWADGTQRAETCIRRVLYNDPAMGIFRHNDAGYEKAKENINTFDLNF
jgi:urocanate hydratase